MCCFKCVLWASLVFSVFTFVCCEQSRKSSSAATAGCGDGVVRGVNLGGWLLLEPWITPVFFEEVNVGDLLDKIVDEWTYAEFLDADTYLERMVNHWSSFVTREDLEKLVEAGISHVRIPVGYWYWDVEEGEPFLPPNMDDTDETSPLFYLKRSLLWMEELGLQASIDLHSGPGSQNGYDNSGRRGEIHWVDDTYPDNRHNIDRTLQILEKISQTMKDWVDSGVISIETLYGIGLLNEPHICGYESGFVYKDVCLQDFYPKGYEVIRKYFSADQTNVIIDVASLGFGDYVGLFEEPTYAGVVIDAHSYQCFGGQNSWAEQPDGWSKHMAESCRIGSDISASPLDVFTGEFSLAITDCQKYLQGGFVTPYDPPDSSDEACSYYNGDLPSYDQNHTQFLKQYFLAQLDSFEAGISGVGWFMWTMKVEFEAGPEWDFLYLWEHGIIPKDLCNRDHICEQP